MTWFLIFLIPFIIALLSTPLVRLFAFKVKAVDIPSERKVHHNPMPRLGGLAIFVAVTVALRLFTDLTEGPLLWIYLGSIIIITLGIVDDIKPLSAKVKLLFQTLAAGVVVYGGITIDFINIPLTDRVLDFGPIGSYIITILWIVGITNALNLIDGLDGLATGVASISLASIFVMALIMGNTDIMTLTLIILAAALGFLVHNFYPAKIFLGDSGSLYLGFMLATISILGFKNIAFVSFIFPIVILAVPIFDTLFAIIRRYRQGTKITGADRGHLHHCLLTLGFSHRKTVLIIYAISAIFGVAAIFITQAGFWIGLVVIVILLLLTIIGIELTGIIGETRKPLTNLIITIRNSFTRNNKE
jgi:UDP-GlcNAc:undecaprenyl-phosphate GlcNAc-1-phosphate transferase